MPKNTPILVQTKNAATGAHIGNSAGKGVYVDSNSAAPNAMAMCTPDMIMIHPRMGHRLGMMRASCDETRKEATTRFD